MPLTKIVKGMLADGSVIIPNNLSTTGTAETTSFLSGDGSWRYVNRLDTSRNYTMSNLTVVGAATVGGEVNAGSAAVTGSITAATIATSGAVASGGAFSFRTTATVTGGAGLRVSGIRQSTGTTLVYYNTVTSEMAFGPASALVNPFNQSLNTFDRPSFVTVSANTGSFNQVNIFNYRLPTADGTANQVMTTNGAGVVTFRTLSDQLVFTTSTVRFAGVTATVGTFTNLIFGSGVRFPTTDGADNQLLVTNGAGQLSWVDYESPIITDQGLYTTSTVSFVGGRFTNVTATNITVSGSLGLNNLTVNNTVTSKRVVIAITTSSFLSGGIGLGMYSGTDIYGGPLNGWATLPNINTSYINGGGREIDPDATWDEATDGSLVIDAEGAISQLISPGGGKTTAGGYNGLTVYNDLSVQGNIVPGTYHDLGAWAPQNIGSPTSRWRSIFAKSLNLLPGTLNFEDENGLNTSTFNVSTGTISVDGTAYVDQPLTQSSSPTFSTVNATSVDLTSLTAVNATITNLTVIGTMTTLNVTTENVTTENIVTQNFADGTSQTTAWTGTVADSQITSVSTSKVNGLSVVGWTNNYNDLINKPTIPSPFDLSTVTNQALFTTSTVTFQNVRTANTLTFAGAVARMAGVRVASFLAPGVTGNIMFYNTTTGEVGWFPGSNQSVNTSSVVTFAGVTTTNITVRGSVVFNDATTQATTGQTTVYARNALPAGVTGRIITISDSGSDLNAPAGNYAPAYWDPDASDWTYIGNSNSVTPI